MRVSILVPALNGTLTLTGAGGTLVAVKDADGKATGAAVTVDLSMAIP